MTTLFTIIFLISSLALILSVLFQEEKTQGLGAVSGEGSNFFSKSKSRSKEAILNRIATVSGIGFMISALVLAAL